MQAFSVGASRTVLVDVNKDSQCLIRQFLRGGPPRMRTVVSERNCFYRSLHRGIMGDNA
jgi:hypothetical protein